VVTGLPADLCRATVDYTYAPPLVAALALGVPTQPISGRLRCNRARGHDVLTEPHETLHPETGEPYQFTHPADSGPPRHADRHDGATMTALPAGRRVATGRQLA
jgi:hypothetical protein